MISAVNSSGTKRFRRLLRMGRAPTGATLSPKYESPQNFSLLANHPTSPLLSSLTFARVVVRGSQSEQNASDFLTRAQHQNIDVYNEITQRYRNLKKFLRSGFL
jgi:hypothetical protein